MVPAGFFDNTSGPTIIAVVDADSFEVQNYQKLPEYVSTKGHPCVVADATSDRIVATSPEAKGLGISRSMKLSAATTKCPGFELLVIPRAQRFDKPDDKINRLAFYKLRGEIVNYIEDYRTENSYYAASVPIAKSGSDEFFLDLTKLVDTSIQDGYMLDIETSRKVVIEGADARYSGEGLDDRMMYYIKEKNKHFKQHRTRYFGGEYRLAVAAQLMDELILQIKTNIDYDCSAGIGSNRVIAKIACKLNKPKGVTALTDEGVKRISEHFNFRDIQGFGGDLGDEIEGLWGQMSMAELRRKVEGNYENAVATFRPENAQKMRDLANARCTEEVEHKYMDAMLSCGKNNLRFTEDSEYKLRLNLLAQEFLERIQEEEEHNKRRPAEIYVEYTREFPDKSDKVRKFQLSFPSNAEGELTNVSVSTVCKEAVEKSIAQNPLFGEHLQEISKMHLRVTKFKSFEEFYEDELAEVGQSVFDFMTGKTDKLYSDSD